MTEANDIQALRAKLEGTRGREYWRSLDALAWYEVLACYRLGIILEGTHARACAGKADRAIGDALHATTLALFARATARIAAS